MSPTPAWRAIISLVTIVISASTRPVRMPTMISGSAAGSTMRSSRAARAHAHRGGRPQHLLLDRARALIAVIDHRQRDAEEDDQRLWRHRRRRATA